MATTKDEVLPWDFCFLYNLGRYTHFNRSKYETQVDPYSVDINVTEKDIFFHTNIFIPQLDAYIRVAFYLLEDLETMQLNHVTAKFLQKRKVSLPYDYKVGNKNMLPFSYFAIQVSKDEKRKTVKMKCPMALNKESGYVDCEQSFDYR